MGDNLIQRQTELSGNIVLLCRYLRNKGYPLSTTEEAEAIMTLNIIPLGSRAVFKTALRAVLAKNEFQFLKFNDHFTEFWDQLSKAVDSKIKQDKNQRADQPSTGKTVPPSLQTLKNWLYNMPTSENFSIASYSNLEVLTRKSFVEMSTEEINLIMRLLQKIAKQISHWKSRLRIPSRKSNTLDMKSTFRYSMRRGNDLLQMRFSKPKDKKLKIVLICDVSKSMDLYSRFFIHMIYAFQNAYDKIETFVFSTAIHRVTEVLSNHDISRALEIISERVPQWSGGTKIGSCLQDFLNGSGHRLLNSKTVVFIVSDGWDTGEPDKLKITMRNIHKQSRKVIWLNPLAGMDGFKPEVMGLQVALPFIDVLAPAHNLESLRNALKYLKSGRRKAPSIFTN